MLRRADDASSRSAVVTWSKVTDPPDDGPMDDGEEGKNHPSEMLIDETWCQGSKVSLRPWSR